MIPTQASTLRCLLALLLVLAIHAAGLERARAAATVPSAVQPSIAGVAVPLCHGGGHDAPDRGPPGSHACCDACALGAPVVLPAGPRPSALRGPGRSAEHGQASARAPVLSRPRTPRFAQGPPAA